MSRNELLPDSNSKIKTTERHRKDSGPIYPDLGLRVFLEGNCFRGGAIDMFVAAGCRAAVSIEECDLVCFLGGEDVDPQLYGETAISGTYCSPSRDAREMDVFTKALSLGKPMFGICRGMQFLAVMNGNKLWQDVDRHAIYGTHPITDIQTGEIVHASSMHHQMVIENDSTFAIAYATGVATTYRSANSELASDVHKDLEAAVFPDIRSFAVQGHPEVAGTPEYTAWCLTKLEEFLEELDVMDDVITIPSDKIDPKVVPGRVLN